MVNISKPEITRLVIRSGWPANIKDDCDYFNIPITELADESKLSSHRIRYMYKGIATYQNEFERLLELNKLTVAFNRIIKKRVKYKPVQL